jgi:hypothetical protein
VPIVICSALSEEGTRGELNWCMGKKKENWCRMRLFFSFFIPHDVKFLQVTLLVFVLAATEGNYTYTYKV